MADIPPKPTAGNNLLSALLTVFLIGTAAIVLDALADSAVQKFKAAGVPLP